MKVIIYATGQLFERYKEKINWSQVVAVADKRVRETGTINSVPLIPAKDLDCFAFDYIAVFSNSLYEEIRMELAGEYFIPEDKIIPWRAVIAGEEAAPAEILKYYKSFCIERRCGKILDMGMAEIPRRCLLKEEFITYAHTGESILDGVKGSGAIQNVNLYDNLYETPKACKNSYDVVFLWDEKQCSEAVLNHVKERTRYILLFTHYLSAGMPVKKRVCEKLEQAGKVACISTLHGLLWTVDTQHKDCGKDMAVYVVAHKKYHVRSDCLYRPLYVGGYSEPGQLMEQEGENIAYLNGTINECTALYWIWKNTDEQYVGLNHYRRYFYNDEIRSMDNYLTMEHAWEILREYDMILPVTYPSEQLTVYEQIYGTVDHELCRRAYHILRGKLEEKQPGYVEAFENVMNGSNTFLCNMFITRREILNRYCEWLFSFLTEAAKETDVEGYDRYSRRVMGFYAERMWSVWLRKNRLRIKKLPYVIVK